MTYGLVQEKCNSIAIALELRPSCTNPLKWHNDDNEEYKSEFQLM